MGAIKLRYQHNFDNFRKIFALALRLGVFVVIVTILGQPC